MKRRPLWVLGAVVTSSFAAYMMVLTLVPLFALELGASAGLVGLMTASISFFPLLLAVRTGSLVDRFGAGRVLLVAAAVLVLSPTFVVVSPTIPALFATQVAVGFANLLAVVAGQAFTASLGSGRRHEGNFGWYTTFVSAGQVVGPIVAGVIADTAGFVVAFAAAGGVAVTSVLASWALTTIARELGEVRRAKRAPQEWRRARALLASAGVQFAMIVTFVVAFAQGAFTAFFPVILENAGYTASVIGGLLSFRASVSMVLRPMLPWISRLFPSRRTALKSMLLLIVASFVAIGLDQAFVTAVVVAAVMGLWWGLAPPLSIVMMVDGASEQERGFALGVRLTANRVAQFVGPLSIGAVADWLSVRTGFYVGGGVVAGFLGLLMVRDRSAPSGVPED